MTNVALYPGKKDEPLVKAIILDTRFQILSSILEYDLRQATLDSFLWLKNNSASYTGFKSLEYF